MAIIRGKKKRKAEKEEFMKSFRKDMKKTMAIIYESGLLPEHEDELRELAGISKQPSSN